MEDSQMAVSRRKEVEYSPFDFFGPFQVCSAVGKTEEASSNNLFQIENFRCGHRWKKASW